MRACRGRASGPAEAQSWHPTPRVSEHRQPLPGWHLRVRGVRALDRSSRPNRAASTPHSSVIGSVIGSVVSRWADRATRLALPQTLRASVRPFDAPPEAITAATAVGGAHGDQGETQCRAQCRAQCQTPGQPECHHVLAARSISSRPAPQGNLGEPNIHRINVSYESTVAKTKCFPTEHLAIARTPYQRPGGMHMDRPSRSKGNLKPGGQ